MKLKPKTAANRALALLKRARPDGFKLKESRITDQGSGSFRVFVRWEEGGFFGGSAEMEVSAEDSFDGKTRVVINAYSGRVAKIADRLRKSL